MPGSWHGPGRRDLVPLVVDEVGHVAGKDLLHLQCHFGLDTLSWARRRDVPVEAPFEYARQHSVGEIVTSLASGRLSLMFSLKATKA